MPKVLELILWLSFYRLCLSFYHLFLGETEPFSGTRIIGLENENEDIKVQSFKSSKVRDIMQKGKILNGLTLIALQWFFLNIKET